MQLRCGEILSPNGINRRLRIISALYSHFGTIRHPDRRMGKVRILRVIVFTPWFPAAPKGNEGCFVRILCGIILELWRRSSPPLPTHRCGKGRSAKRTRPTPICRLASAADASETALSARSERLGRSAPRLLTGTEHRTVSKHGLAHGHDTDTHACTPTPTNDDWRAARSMRHGTTTLSPTTARTHVLDTGDRAKVLEGHSRDKRLVRRANGRVDDQLLLLL